MARIDDSGQWIVLMGILVSIGIFFLALVINQATLVGQTTAEGVLEFPKNEIQDTRDEIARWASHIDKLSVNGSARSDEEKSALKDISTLGRYRRNAEIWYNITQEYPENDVCTIDVCTITIHYNNGVTEYNERNANFYPER